MNRTQAKQAVKYADIIKAFSEGAVIQYRSPQTKGWRTLDALHFGGEGDYRIKPAPPRVFYTNVYSTNESAITSLFTDEKYARAVCGKTGSTMKLQEVQDE